MPDSPDGSGDPERGDDVPADAGSSGDESAEHTPTVEDDDADVAADVDAEADADVDGDAGVSGSTPVNPGPAESNTVESDLAEPATAESPPGGRSLAPDEQYCPSCGEPIKEAAEICPECGVRRQPAPSTGKDRVTAGILALLLGGIGAHKFYLEETGMGVLYLCFSWTLIPALVGFIEGVLYLTKSDAEFERKHVN